MGLSGRPAAPRRAPKNPATGESFAARAEVGPPGAPAARSATPSGRSGKEVAPSPTSRSARIEKSKRKRLQAPKIQKENGCRKSTRHSSACVLDLALCQSRRSTKYVKHALPKTDREQRTHTNGPRMRKRRALLSGSRETFHCRPRDPALPLPSCWTAPTSSLPGELFLQRLSSQAQPARTRSGKLVEED